MQNLVATILEDYPNSKFYGIPRGGSIVAAMTGRPVDRADEADVLIDDIVDSGRTKDFWKARFPDKDFVALYTRTELEHAGWLVFPWEVGVEAGPEENIVRFLEYIGEDVHREGLVETPKRVVRSWDRLFGGYRQSAKDTFKVFEDDTSNEMVVLKNVEFYSTCEHHLLPFYGRAHIAYIPDGKVVGISKLARLLECYARRLQIQERLCQQVTDCMDEVLNPLGAACVLEAQHFCMTSRGVEKQNSVMTTSSLTGVFKQPAVRAEFFQIIRG